MIYFEHEIYFEDKLIYNIEKALCSAVSENSQIF